MNQTRRSYANDTGVYPTRGPGVHTGKLITHPHEHLFGTIRNSYVKSKEYRTRMRNSRGLTPAPAWTGRHLIDKLGHILTDRGSKYAVSGGPVTDRAAIDEALKHLRKERSYAKATHNTWGAVLQSGGPIKGDDGEAGAGMVILRMLEREQLYDHLIVVTRWYGGKHLGGDRFRHVQTCVTAYLDRLR